MKNQHIKVVVSDLDGTLLNPNHVVSEYTKKTIRKLTDSGVHFMIATGRHHVDAERIKKSIGIEAYLVTGNGSVVKDPTGKTIYQALIDESIAKKILEIDVAAGVFKNIYQGDHWMIEEIDDVFKDYYAKGEFEYKQVLFKDYYDQPISKIFFTSLTSDKLKPLAIQIERTFGDFVDVTFSIPECLEIMPKGVNKGQAILETIPNFMARAEEVIAFGDGLNDLEMLSVVGRGYIMGNADQTLKEKLPKHEVIESNAQDGVAQKLKALFDIESNSV